MEVGTESAYFLEKMLLGYSGGPLLLCTEVKDSFQVHPGELACEQKARTG